MPRGRDKTSVGGYGEVHRRGDGLGGGLVGTGDFGGSSPGSSKGPGGHKFSIIILIIAFLLGGGGFSLSNMLPQGSVDSAYNDSSTFSSWSDSQHSDTLNTQVANGSRHKYTKLLGQNKDKNTLMLYMCGADLESRSGMATKDLQEIAQATTGQNMNVIVYTGGAKKWQNNLMSSSYNQIYRIHNGQFEKLVSNDGRRSMTDADTLTHFIKWTKQHYQANRYHLILWDHGGGPISGYGYDENHPRTSMDLTQINQALQEARVKFDFIGFDACLMATLETAIMLSKHADYLIASEETEPGTGWYYTHWINKLSQNSSMKTIEIGKNIIDDFISACSQGAYGQKATLSIVDLAELSHSVPEKFSRFSQSLSKMIQQDQYQKVASARNSSRSFAVGNGVDTVDLVHLAHKINNSEAQELIKVIKEAIKYNKTSSLISNAYGLSIYFPKETSSSKVNTMVNVNQKIGVDEAYSKCLVNYAKVSGTGQAAYGGSQGSLTTLLNSLSGQASSSQSTQLLQQLMLSYLQSQFSSGQLGQIISNKNVTDYIKAHHLDDSQLNFKKNEDKYQLSLKKEDWSLITSLKLKKFYDDNQGYIELGEDNDYQLEGTQLTASTDHTWVAINNQIVSYIHLDSEERENDHYQVTGRVPCLINNVKSNLIIIYNNDHPHGYVAGASSEGTHTIPKNMTTLKQGDKIEFIADYYNYKGQYINNYKIGQPITYRSSLKVSNMKLRDSKQRIIYKFTDIYNQNHYSNVIKN